MRLAVWKYGVMGLVAAVVAACGNDSLPGADDGCPAREVYVSFPVATSSSVTRAATRALIHEEGEAYEIMYGVFRNRRCVLHRTNLLPQGQYHTGSAPYKLPGVDVDNLDVNSEIFVIVNPTTTMKNTLSSICEDPSKTDEERYLAWKNHVHDGDLNTESATAPSRSIDRPLMAGYLKLDREAGAVVVVPVEHIYCRIWCYFEWRNLPQATKVVVDEIEFKHLRAKTYLFNTAAGDGFNNLPEEEARQTEWQIVNLDALQQPFFGELYLDKDEPPYHLGDLPQMMMTPQSHLTHSVVCRYARSADGSADMLRSPLRYYIYSYEWASMSLNDDVEIVVTYHFTTEDNEVVRKRSSARLYDETYYPGKRHHGLLRNYTYRLRCIVNTMVDQLEVQVTSHPWYKVVVDDIPPFE
ncbi:hypothetical protein [Alistipes sp.]|uniref:hypothetical protein n=1 Tax=Alistipes sp. TaxID=1872444 RepID=UPI0025BE85A0|nr:hypothetical protein [Alistipes sp.]